MEQKYCPKCKKPVGGEDFFCPFCGFKMREPTITVSVAKQIGMYLVSVLLPPFGLIPAIKYLRFGDDNAKKVGVVIIVLTVIATVVTIWLFVGFMGKVNQIIQYQMSTPDIPY